MMREILFRGKQKYIGKWVYGSFFSPNAIMKRGKEFGADKTYTILPETVGQFTGLTDKNDKKIFEGDIIKVSDETGGASIYKVVFINGIFGVVVKNGGYACTLVPLSKECIEVIGNVHDNPELLKGDKDNG